MGGVPLLGVDAGGTATRAVLVRDGDEVARFTDGPLNLILHADAFDRLVSLITKSGAAGAGLGLAGLRGSAEARALEARLRAATGIPVAVADDTEAALLGAFDGGPGIVVIAGTGSNAFGRDADGRAARVGGYGFLLGDEGSAYSIANKALRAALHSFDGTGPKSAALEAAVVTFYATDVDGIVRLVHGTPGDRQIVARLAETVMALDDPVMGEILDHAADSLAAMAAALRDRLGPGLPVAMHGGIFRDQHIRGRFVAATGAVEPAKSPEFGAVHLAAGALTERDAEQDGVRQRDMGWAQP